MALTNRLAEAGSRTTTHTSWCIASAGTFRRGASYDPVRVGLDREAQDGFLYDTRIPGNGNMGHPFGAPLSERERMAVIEYLKTL